ncbi:MAG: arginine--tRNA ligase [Methanosarcinales archaeon]|nr:arginine--tRNA ligase [Methanosarcinales archaeon]
MFLDFMSEVETLLLGAIDQCRFELPENGSNRLQLEISPHADVASSVAFRLAPVLRRSPKAIAEELHRSMTPGPGGLVDQIELAGPYLNFFVNRKFLNSVVVQAQGQECWTGRLTDRAIVEHTSANPNGPLHVGHIRNSVIGDTIARVLKRAGSDVETQYYVNDMGRQIAIVVWGKDRYGLDSSKPDHAIARVYIEANRALNADPELKREIDILIERYEGKDQEVAAKVKSAVDYAISGIEETLRRLNISHDAYHWESEYAVSGEMADILQRLENTGLTQWEDGAFQLDLSGYGFEKKMVLKRADGTSLYITRDLAYHRWKAQHCDRVVDILGADHKLISSQLRTALGLLGVREPEVVIFEFVSLPDGSMSTRKGKFISADELLDEVEKQAFEEVTTRRPEEGEEFRRDVARQVALGAVRYDIIKVSPEKATTFDWKNALDFEKLSAPFIQYSHARACSILRKAGMQGSFDPELLQDENEVALIKKIAEFDLVVDRSARELKPHQLANYARELAESFNQFYRFSPVLEVEPALRASRLALVNAGRNALRVTLETLGIPALESM